jgi:arylamine N-acetyltransferase
VERSWEPEIMYQFNAGDALRDDCTEFVAGREAVLTDKECFFTQKRVVCIGTPTGHLTLCRDRLKEVATGLTVETMLPNEVAWRAALAARFGIALVD